jgi:predicted aconitase with swiveling domain
MTGQTDRSEAITPNKASGAEPILYGQTLVAGNASGPTIVLTQPLSFWGGYDVKKGRIIDPRHPQTGRSVAEMIVIMPHAKGSSSSSSVLAEAIRNGTGPRGIILREKDLIISIGAIVARELYGTEVPVVVLNEMAFASACQMQYVRIEASQTAEGADIFQY